MHKKRTSYADAPWEHDNYERRVSAVQETIGEEPGMRGNRQASNEGA